MPSSMIFASLVVLWLLILVPAIARHRQEVARPTVAALSGRVLERPRRRHGPDVGSELEVDVDEDVDQVDEGHPTATRTDHDDNDERDDDRDDNDGRDDIADRDAGGSDDRDGDRHGEAYSDDRDDRLDDHGADDDYDGPEARDDHEADDDPGVDDDGWERPPPRYRPGRGGFDPEAAAVAAKARYAFRQRVVLSMLIVAILSGVIAAIAVPGAWWLHGAVDVLLVGYLIYLRRQVRLEEAIRERRASRMAGTRRPRAADDPDLDEWARRGREATRRPAGDRYDEDGYDDEGYEADGYDADHDDVADPDGDDHDHGRERRERARGESSADAVEGEPALPRLRPAPPPPLPAGTALVEATEDDPELHDLAGPARRDYRHAVGE